MAQVSAKRRPVEFVRTSPVETKRAKLFESTFVWGLLSAALYWAALPPLDLWPLAWLAPVPLVVLIQRPRLGGRRPYLMLWTAGFIFWLASLHWLTLPHWATAFGWLALSFYLAFYWPLFVGLSRVGVHRLGLSPLVVAPVVWVGLDLARAHALTGFMMVALGHTQYRWLPLIQIADLGGAYLATFVMVFVAAALARMLPLEGRKAAWWPALPIAGVLALVLGYGYWRLADDSSRPGPRVALIQGSIDTKMKADEGQSQQIFDEYFGLSREALAKYGPVDLIVWPETMFRYPLYLFDDDYKPPPDVKWTPAELEAASQAALRTTATILDSPMLLGIDRAHYRREEVDRYNAALFLDRLGNTIASYDKTHLVMFGEYVPLASRFPWLYRLTPLATGVDAGQDPVSVAVAGARFSPNICFESTLPHLIRAQVNELRARGAEPDVLVNLTNDGWFWGSSELDLHLTCGVFRAVECRKPMLIAANTGFSAWIEPDGSVRDQGPRRATGVILATPSLSQRRSLYLVWGDWPAAVCLAGCLLLAGVGLAPVIRSHRLSRLRPAA